MRRLAVVVLACVVAAVRAEDVQRIARLYLQHPTIGIVAPPGR